MPKSPTAERVNTHPAVLRNAMQEGLTRMEAIATTFDRLHDLKRDLVKQAMVVDEAEYFLGFGPDDLPMDKEDIERAVHITTKEPLSRGISIRGPRTVVKAGYVALLLEHRGEVAAKEAQAWRERPEVQRFIGRKLTIASLPSASGVGLRAAHGTNSKEWVNYSFRITGKVADISILGNHGGRIGFEDVEYLVGENEADLSDSFLEREADTGAVEGLFLVDRSNSPVLVQPQVQFRRPTPQYFALHS